MITVDRFKQIGTENISLLLSDHLYKDGVTYEYQVENFILTMQIFLINNQLLITINYWADLFKSTARIS